MKVNLIFPDINDNVDVLQGTSPILDVMCRILGYGTTSFTPPLSLLMLAAVTPPDIELKIVDERIEKIDLDDAVDLVGITVNTRAALKAYQIAAEYRKRGVKVVLGGIHPSALPQEAAQHADSLVLGEGEGIWSELLDDFRQGRLHPVYRGRPQLDLDLLPFPRRELIRHPEMYVTTKVITATRGCENTCTFCSAGIGLIKKFRKRSIGKVIEELEQTPGRLAIFMDDNWGWDREYAKSLVRLMQPLRLRWSAAVTADTIEDHEFVELAARSGCFMMGVGFESISPTVIANIRKGKTNRPENYARAIKRLHDAGIIAWGSFMVGFDDDDELTFPKLADFIYQTDIEIADVHVLTPFPGSVLFKKYDSEGRMLHKDWQYYGTSIGSCVFLPKQMTPEELVNRAQELVERLSSWKSILPRVFRSPTRFSMGTFAALHVNLENRQDIPTRKAQAQSYKQSFLVH